LRHPQLLADPNLGTISSLRCHKSRSRSRRINKRSYKRGLNQALPGLLKRVMARSVNTQFVKLFSSRSTDLASTLVSGGGRRDRTDDLMLAKHALSQLSYAPVPGTNAVFVDEVDHIARLRPSGYAGHASFALSVARHAKRSEAKRGGPGKT
jgi:hypothetical protein